MLKKKGDFVILLVGRLLQTAITLLSLRLSTTLLPQEELGKVYYIVVVQSFFALLLINPVGQFFNRHINYWEEKKVIFACYINQSIYVFLIAMLGVLVLSAASFFGVVSAAYDITVVTGAVIFSQSLNQTIVPLLNMLHDRRAFVVFSLMTAILSIVFSFLFLTYMEKTAGSWILGVVVGNILISGAATYWLKLKFGGGWILIRGNVGGRLKEIFRFSLPIGLATLFMWFLNAGYRIPVEKKYGFEYLALLGVGLAISNQIFSIVESLVTQYLVPDLYKNVEKADLKVRTKLINNYLAELIPLYFALAFFLTFSVKYMYPYLVSEKYFECYYLSVFGVWIEFFRVTTNALGIISQIEKKTKSFLYPYVVGGVVLFLMLTFEEHLRVGILMSLIFSGIVVFLLMFLLMRKNIFVLFPWRNTIFLSMLSLPSVLFFVSSVNGQVLNFRNFILTFVGGMLFLIALVFYFIRMYRQQPYGSSLG